MASEPTFVELITDVADGAKEVASAHIQQLRHEISTEIQRALSAVLALLVGGIFGFIGIAFLAVTLVRVLVDFAAWPEWTAWLVVGGICLAAAAIAVAAGIALWKAVRAVPDRTIHSIQESLSWINNN